MLKLRLVNNKADIVPSEVIVKSKEFCGDYIVSFIIKSEKYQDCLEYIVFNKLYINEFLFLQRIGVVFE